MRRTLRVTYSLQDAENSLQIAKNNEFKLVDKLDEELIRSVLPKSIADNGDEFCSLMNELHTQVLNILTSTDRKDDFRALCKIAIYIYVFLSSNFSFSEKDVNNDKFWRFISCTVLPEAIYKLTRSDEKRLYLGKNKQNFICKLWLFINLVWQGNEQDTEDVLDDDNVWDNNAINILIKYFEQSRLYRPIIYRRLANGILKHSEFNYPRMRRLYDIQPLDLFLQKLTVYSTKIIPELYDGGVDGFLDDFVFKDERLE